MGSRAAAAVWQIDRKISKRSSKRRLRADLLLRQDKRSQIYLRVRCLTAIGRGIGRGHQPCTLLRRYPSRLTPAHLSRHALRTEYDAAQIAAFNDGRVLLTIARPIRAKIPRRPAPTGVLVLTCLQAIRSSRACAAVSVRHQQRCDQCARPCPKTCSPASPAALRGKPIGHLSVIYRWICKFLRRSTTSRSTSSPCAGWRRRHCASRRICTPAGQCCSKSSDPLRRFGRSSQPCKPAWFHEPGSPLRPAADGQANG